MCNTTEVEETYSIANIAESKFPYRLKVGIREAKPIFWSEEEQAWIVLKYQDIVSVLKSKTFSRCINKEPPFNYENLLLFIKNNPMNKSMEYRTWYRKNIIKMLVQLENSFSINKIIHTTSIDLLHRIDKQANFNISRDFIVPILEKILSAWFGFTPADSQTISYLITQLTPFITKKRFPNENDETSMKNIFDCLNGYILQKKQSSNSLREYFIECQKQNIDIFSISSNLLSIIIPLFVTTKIQIINIIYGLLSYPDIYSKFHENITVLNMNHIHELIRNFSAILYVTRYSLTNQILHHENIKKNEEVRLIICSANMDNDVFSNPNKIDTNRKNAKDHLTFSDGIYSCRGQSMSLEIVKQVLLTVINKFPYLNCKRESELEFSGGLIGYNELELLINPK